MPALSQAEVSMPSPSGGYGSNALGTTVCSYTVFPSFPNSFIPRAVQAGQYQGKIRALAANRPTFSSASFTYWFVKSDKLCT